MQSHKICLEKLFRVKRHFYRDLWYLLGLLLAESWSVSRVEAARVWGSGLLQHTRRVRYPVVGTQTWAAGALPNRCLESGAQNDLVHNDRQ